MTGLTTIHTNETRSASERAVAGHGMTEGSVRTWLRLEGLAAFAAGLALYGWAGGSWLLLIPLLLVPDVSVIGYLAGNRVGAFAYNLVHTWAPGLVCLVVGTALDSTALQIVAAILIAHVGMDRTAGFGLKLPSSFQDTHLGRIGRAGA
jgi:hypothetical protein